MNGTIEGVTRKYKSNTIVYKHNKPSQARIFLIKKKKEHQYQVTLTIKLTQKFKYIVQLRMSLITNII